MSTPIYVPGQRWVSSTEPEAGLGIVVDIQYRQVKVTFPAIAEQRVYAVNNAPLSRVLYHPGDRVRSQDGLALTVVDIREHQGRLVYIGSDSDGEHHLLDELDLDSFVMFSKPRDRLFSGQIDNSSRFALRRETLDHLARLQQSGAAGLLGARVQLLPHQFYIAAEVGRRHAPRVLLADEVGLGKTIEAGLIIHQQLLTGRAGRVLILVPDSLIHQWLVEMLRRFNLMFTVLDEARCQAQESAADDIADDDALAGDGDEDNPFASAQLVLCGLSWLVENPQRLQQAREAGWDLLVVDEAHHLQWSEASASPAYRAVESLAALAQGLLLLTATPEQLGMESHFARLRLLDPDRYHDLARFRDEEAGYRRVSALVETLRADNVAEVLREGSLLDDLAGYLGDSAAERLRRALDEDLDKRDAEGLARVVNDIVTSLLDRHGTGRVLFRNTREAVAGFPERRFYSCPLPASDAGLEAGGQPGLEQLIQPERALGDDWVLTDPRVRWLGDWLPRQRDGDGRPEKVLVICARAATAEALGQYLDLRLGIRAGVFHEGMSLVERDRTAAYFADSEDSAQVLVCSEIGSEGRNFQFARHLVLFDLPLNPDLLEQRIGRLDRIGQRHTVEIHVPHYDGGAQAMLVRWYHEGLNAFERVCPMGATVYEQVGDRLRHCLQYPGESAEFEALVTDTARCARDALDRLRQGRDRLLEMTSCRPDEADEVIAGVMDAESPVRLADYMEQVFDQYGVEHSFHSTNALVLHPGDHMRCEHFPGLLEDGMTVTFSRAIALVREDMHFLSWEHPMVTGAMDMIAGGDFGNTALCTLKLPPLKPGTLLLEAFFVLHCAAPKALQLHRFLPLTTRRLVVDANGNDLSRAIGVGHFDKLGQKVARNTAQDVVRHARPQLTAMVQQAEALVTVPPEDGDDPVTAAIAAMERSQAEALERLTELAKVNPNIRQDEIDHVARTTEALRTAMARAEWRLDALRVAITV